ncbi:MAG: CDP-glycerol glycerophosphotransferase family protein [Prevotellaceae bacterium]|nr:CDP-glycerol glycerophosphotransferase family protein [Prevotellaceae bacterium]
MLHRALDRGYKILFFPTWRKYLIGRSVDNKNGYALVDSFTSTVYYQRITSFLNNPNLAKLLREHGLELAFYPHPEAQKMLPLVSVGSENIQLISRELFEMKDFMLDSILLITDYSGVAFDFAYMKKPLVYYQLDLEEYHRRHYRDANNCERVYRAIVEATPAHFSSAKCFK